MLALNVKDQALYVGIRSTFYRIATMQDKDYLLCWLVDWKYGGNIKYAPRALPFFLFWLAILDTSP